MWVAARDGVAGWKSRVGVGMKRDAIFHFYGPWRLFFLKMVWMDGRKEMDGMSICEVTVN
jgi:hypothetical protein